MSIKEVLMLGNPRLREKSSDIEDFDLNFVQNLVDFKGTLTYLLKTKNLGRAITAPQVCVKKNLLYFQLSDKSLYMVNPKVTWKSEEIINVWDSCYSFEISFFVEIQRYKTIKVEFQDENGNLVFDDFSDDLSELIQHEIDHINGILATDHVNDDKKIIIRSEWDMRYKKLE